MGTDYAGTIYPLTPQANNVLESPRGEDRPAPAKPAPTILLVDDDEDSRVMYSAVLMTAGYRVLFARNGAEGLDVAIHARPDLILMDLVMPRLNGYAALRGLKDDPVTAAIPVLALTGQVSNEEAPQVKEAGFQEVLVK